MEKTELKLAILGTFTYCILDSITFIMCYLLCGSVEYESSLVIRGFVKQYGVMAILGIKLGVFMLAYCLIANLDSNKQRKISYGIASIFGCVGTLANVLFITQWIYG